MKTHLMRVDQALESVEKKTSNEEKESLSMRFNTRQENAVQLQWDQVSDDDEELNSNPVIKKRIIRRPPNPWTLEETMFLERGMNECGPNWKVIELRYGVNGTHGTQLKNRTSSDLKYKARTERNRRARLNLPLPPFNML